jgi:peptidyl-prolyl cis-trans isomerase D
VRVRYVAYRPEDHESQIELTDGEISEYYELEKDSRFTDPEEVRARHILVKTPTGGGDEAKATARKEADDLLAQVRAGGDFAALAKQHSADPGSAAKGGDLGFFPRGRMTPAFENAAFALDPGQLSEVVETPFGFHIIKVEERHAGGPKPLDAVRDEITKTLKHERALAKAREQAEADRKTIVKGTAFDEALAARTIADTPLFAANQTLPGLGQGFSEAAFALREHEVSDLVETDDAIYLLTPVERSAAHVPPLADVRDRVEADARRARGEAAAREKAEQLRTRAVAVGFAQAASEAGAAVEEAEPFDRRAGTIDKLGPVPELRTDAFALTAESPVGPKVYTAAGDAVVVALRERVAADMTGFAADKDRLLENLLQQKRQAVLTAYMSFLKERAVRNGALAVQRDVTRG